VIDINEEHLSVSGQRLVLSKIRRMVSQSLGELTAPVDHVILFADELNRFAPKNASSDGALAEIKEELEEIGDRGRSTGEVVFGMEQRPSEVTASIGTNAGATLMVPTVKDELNSRVYDWMEPGEKKVLDGATDDQKGMALLKHDAIKEELFLRFPRPPCAQTTPPLYETMSEVLAATETPEKERSRMIDFHLWLLGNEETSDVLDSAAQTVDDALLDRLETPSGTVADLTTPTSHRTSFSWGYYW